MVARRVQFSRGAWATDIDGRVGKDMARKELEGCIWYRSPMVGRLKKTMWREEGGLSPRMLRDGLFGVAIQSSCRTCHLEELLGQRLKSRWTCQTR